MGDNLDADIESRGRLHALRRRSAAARTASKASPPSPRPFPQRGPRDPKGRSLRDFDLETRLFRYPLSYMIYSAAFDALPDGVRARIYRLYEVLAGRKRRHLKILRTRNRTAFYWR